jgi:nucleoside-diphosphate-sugar epimerase
MKVFVTGGTGAIGRYAIPQLVDAGHEVSALARGAEKAALVRAWGASPVVVSLFDAEALAGAFAGHEAVANLATSIPTVAASTRPGAWDMNNRIRTEGSTAVVAAARRAGVARLVQESITFPYPDRGDEWIDEDVAIDAGPALGAMLTSEANTRAFAEEGGIGVVLRYAAFYGPGSHHTEAFVRAARRHIGVAVGTPSGYVSSIHLEDAASAVVAALHAPSGTYNVGDDDPVTKKELARVLGAALGKRPWLYLPGRFAAVSGKGSVALRRSQRIANRRFRDATGWAPKYPSVRDGLPATVAALGAPPVATAVTAPTAGRSDG